MISDRDLATLCELTYSGAPPTWGTPDVHAFLTMRDGYTIVAFQGSASMQDWLRDFDAFVVNGTLTRDHKGLGLVHAGFFGDVAQIFATVLKELPGDPVIVTGHSKGAAEALIFAAMLLAATDRNVAKVTTFGTPAPGALRGLLDNIPGRDYRNEDDPVAAVPPYLPHPRALTHIAVPPLAGDPWGILAAHHVQLYAQGADATAENIAIEAAIQATLNVP